MKSLRLSALLLALSTSLILAACGGGGGGGTGATPPVNGGGNPPPTSTPTPGATGSPAASPTPVPTATPVGTSSVTVSAEENFINGDANWYTSGSASWSNTAGGTSSAPDGTSAADGTGCQSVTEGTSFPQDKFSQHAFVGFFNNGAWEALPQAIGMVKPVAPTAGTPSHPSNTYAVENNQCEYNVHTHDYSGLVHIEDTGFAQSNTFMPAYATLQTLFDLWGANLGVTGITAGNSAMAGPVSIYVGTPGGKDSQNNDLVSSYALYSGSPADLQLSKHMAVWIVVGTAAPSIGGVQGLPQVRFVVSN